MRVPKQNISVAMVIWLFFSQLPRRDSIRWALAAIKLIFSSLLGRQFLFLLDLATSLSPFKCWYSGTIGECSVIADCKDFTVFVLPKDSTFVLCKWLHCFVKKNTISPWLPLLSNCFSAFHHSTKKPTKRFKGGMSLPFLGLLRILSPQNLSYMLVQFTNSSFLW